MGKGPRGAGGVRKEGARHRSRQGGVKRVGHSVRGLAKGGGCHGSAAETDSPSPGASPKHHLPWGATPMPSNRPGRRDPR